MSVDQRALRDALGCFVTGVCVVSTLTEGGEALGVTVNSFNSVSLEPPLVLYSLARTAGRCDDFQRAGRFAVNVLGDDQQTLSEWFARPGSCNWDGIQFETGPTGCPIVPDAPAAFDCLTEAVHDGGDHLIFIGRVQHILHRPERAPLLYYRGRYGRLSGRLRDG